MTALAFNKDQLDKLFPAPSFASAFKSQSAPTPNPGFTPESTAALQRLLKENHQRHHLFYNDEGFHNHLAHHLFAAYSLGAPPSILQAAFDKHASYQRLAYKSPQPVTLENWKEFLGNQDYYNAHLSFFNDEIWKHGLAATFERYVFTQDANWTSEEPRMLDRFLSALVHPMIHFGHAAEFGVPGMAVEGLAQIAVHPTDHKGMFDRLFPSSNSAPNSKRQIHAFTILARILADSRLEAGKTCHLESDDLKKFQDTVKNAGQIIREYVELWDITEDTATIQARVEELQWVVILMFALGGWRKNKPFKADFFLVHLVTSNLFLPSILSLLQPANRIMLMRAYLSTCLAWFISRGRPSLDIEGFFTQTSLNLNFLTKQAGDHPAEAVGNPWYTLLDYTVIHEDEHYIKAERAMAHAAAFYGTRPKGRFKDTELKGAEHIDGTLFLRAGRLFMAAMDLEAKLRDQKNHFEKHEYEDVQAGWDRGGLGWDEAWE